MEGQETPLVCGKASLLRSRGLGRFTDAVEGPFRRVFLSQEAMSGQKKHPGVYLVLRVPGDAASSVHTKVLLLTQQPHVMSWKERGGGRAGRGGRG